MKPHITLHRNRFGERMWLCQSEGNSYSFGGYAKTPSLAYHAYLKNIAKHPNGIVPRFKS